MRAQVPLALLFGLLALSAVVSLVAVLVTGGGAWRAGLSISQAVFHGTIAWSVGVELPRHVRAWDEALAERRALGGDGA